MGKFRKSLREKQAFALKNTKESILKEKRKKKAHKRLSNDIYESDLKSLSLSNEIAKNINIQNSKKKKKHDSRNKFNSKATGRSNVPTKYPKIAKKAEIFQEVQINADDETKHKKKYKRQRHDRNFNHPDKVVKVKDSFKEITKKKLQNPAIKSINLEHRKIKLKKLKEIDEKKIKQISKIKAQQIKSDKMLKVNKHKMKIKQLEEMLNNKTETKQTLKSSVLSSMMTRLKASKFRLINETLYNNNSSQSNQYLKKNPDAFKAYHAGYKQQLEQWPINPLDIIISSIKTLPMDNVIADFGCGEAQLAASVPHAVHSIDFIALNNRVIACDMAHTPLLTNSIDIAVFCLSLMGSNLNDYIIEANRVLKYNGILKIVEIESRFEDVKNFIKLLRSYGFKNIWKNLSHDIFYFMDFKKKKISMKRKNLPSITLKSYLYKK
ncbi:hypothetical protein P5V15_002860 [Pogonomyrmex californicus]